MAREKMLHDEAAQNKLRKRDRFNDTLRRSDLAEVMALPAGRRFMYDMIFNKLGLMNVYLPSDSGIYRHEGARQVGRDLAQELQMHHTEAYVLMFTERLREQKVDQQVKSAAENATQGDDSDA